MRYPPLATALLALSLAVAGCSGDSHTSEPPAVPEAASRGTTLEGQIIAEARRDLSAANRAWVECAAAADPAEDDCSSIKEAYLAPARKLALRFQVNDVCGATADEDWIGGYVRLSDGNDRQAEMDCATVAASHEILNMADRVHEARIFEGVAALVNASLFRWAAEMLDPRCSVFSETACPDFDGRIYLQLWETNVETFAAYLSVSRNFNG